MEKYTDFLNRISYQQAELQIGEGRFNPDKRVYEKVQPNNTFKPFYGDTTVFELDSCTKFEISEIIDVLYTETPECFCEKIDKNTLHMTLHDLSASEHLENVSSEIFYNEVKILQMLKNKPIESETIKMKSNFIINMVGTSLVLTLVPESENEWNKLQALYDIINEVKVCPYPYLTPHITLAYFNHDGFDEISVQKLRNVVYELNRKSFDITLYTNKLYYQKFVSMNNYVSVFNFSE